MECFLECCSMCWLSCVWAGEMVPEEGFFLLDCRSAVMLCAWCYKLKEKLKYFWGCYKNICSKKTKSKHNFKHFKGFVLLLKKLLGSGRVFEAFWALHITPTWCFWEQLWHCLDCGHVFYMLPSVFDACWLTKNYLCFLIRNRNFQSLLHLYIHSHDIFKIKSWNFFFLLSIFLILLYILNHKSSHKSYIFYYFYFLIVKF